MVHGKPWLDVTVVEIVKDVCRSKAVLRVDNIFARSGVSLILHMIESKIKLANSLVTGSDRLERLRSI